MSLEVTIAKPLVCIRGIYLSRSKDSERDFTTLLKALTVNKAVTAKR